MSATKKIGWVLLGVTSGVVALSFSTRYPQEVCKCSYISKSNPYEITLNKRLTERGIEPRIGSGLLGPHVKVVKTIGKEAIVVSNFKSEKYMTASQDGSHFGNSLQKKYSKYQEGYFLHKCDSPSALIYLGMDRDEAIKMAVKVFKEHKGE